MKARIVVSGMLALMLVASCKKSHTDPTQVLGPTYPGALNAIITPAIIATLQSHGAVINDGLTPPIINGIYLMHNDYCSFDNSGGNAAGLIFDDYKLKFSNQNKTALTITYQYKDVSSAIDYGSDNNATYITGTNNAFTVFAQSTGVSYNNISYILLDIISGTLQSGSIKNLQRSTYLVSKGPDPNNQLEDVGSTRIFIDQDGASPTQTTFSAPENNIQTTGTGGSVLLSFIQ